MKEDSQNLYALVPTSLPFCETACKRSDCQHGPSKTMCIVVLQHCATTLIIVTEKSCKKSCVLVPRG